MLRGSQGTLSGRNATSGVVNIVTAKPEMGVFRGAAAFEYGNYNSIKAKGMVNLPLGDTLGVRVTGYYLNRDGFTDNLFDNSDIGGRLNNRRDFDSTNANSTLGTVLTSVELFRIRGTPEGLALGSVYGPDGYVNFDKLSDVRTVNAAFTPEYFADELQLQAHVDQNIGAMNLSLTGICQETTVDPRQDYNLGILDRTGYATGLNILAFLAANGIPTGLPGPAFVPGSNAYFAPIADALIPNGPNGQLCTSDNDDGNRGVFEGNAIRSDVPLSFARSNQEQSAWSAKAFLPATSTGRSTSSSAGFTRRQRSARTAIT